MLGWPVPAELDAVAVGVAQIQGFAHAVVRGAVDGDGRGENPPQRVGEDRARWVENRDVERPVEPRGGGEVPLLSQVFSPM